MNTPVVGEFAKVWLPGETPWAECVAVHSDGSWEGRIDNRLFAEMSDDERREFVGQSFGPQSEPLPRLHGFKQNDIARFVHRDNVWQPAERSGGRA